MASETLAVGQVVSYCGTLWRVELVNPSRARIVPLTKRHIVLSDREFDADAKGINISAGSCVEVVEDVERAQIALEERRLQVEQRRLEHAKHELAAIEQEEHELGEASQRLQRERQELRAARATAHHQPTGSPRTAGGWHITSAPPPLTTGSQATQVWGYVQAHPGLDTSQLTQALPAVKNMPQCLSRLKLTGYLEK